MRRVFLLVFVALSTGCTTQDKLADEATKWINAAVPLKQAAFVPLASFGLLQPLLSLMPLFSVIALTVFMVTVLRSDLRTLGGEALQAYLVITLVASPVLLFSLFDKLGRELWSENLTTTFVLNQLGWGWPPRMDIDPITGAMALLTIENLAAWHAFTEIFLIIFSVYALINAAVFRDVRPLLVTVAGWIAWSLFAPFWQAELGLIGKYVTDNNLIKSSLAGVNFGFTLLTLVTVGLINLAPFALWFAPQAPKTERVEVEGGGRLGELIEALVIGGAAGYTGGRAARSDGSSGGNSNGGVVYGPDPQANPKLPPPRQPKAEPKQSPAKPNGPDESHETHESHGSDADDEREVISPRSPQTAKQSRSGTGSVSGRSGDQAIRVAPNGAIKTREPKAEPKQSPAKPNGPGESHETYESHGSHSFEHERKGFSSRSPQTSKRSPSGSEATDECLPIAVREPEAEESDLRDQSEEESAPIFVDNGDDGRFLFRAKEDVDDKLGLPLISKNAFIIPDEVEGAVNDTTGILSYGIRIPWSKIEKIPFTEVSDE